MEMNHLSLKAVTFDFGGTLVQGDLDKEAFGDQLSSYIRSLGVSVSEKQLRNASLSILEKLRKIRSSDREIPLEDLYGIMLRKLGIPPKEYFLSQIHEFYIDSFKIELVEGVEDTLRRLMKKYRLAVISNASSNIVKYAIKKFDLQKYFDVVTVSRDVGIRKPDPRIFEYTFKELSVKPYEAVHVGDSIESDIIGAKKIGMFAIWINREGLEDTSLSDCTIKSITELTAILL